MNAAVNSLVVVLPTLPVIATTCAPERRRTFRAIDWSAWVVSPTTMVAGAVPFARVTAAAVSLTITPAAPWRTASAMKS